MRAEILVIEVGACSTSCWISSIPIHTVHAKVCHQLKYEQVSARLDTHQSLSGEFLSD
jgi:hypothetical protein